MRQINLKEYESSEYRLTTDQLDALLRESKTLDLTIEPVRGARGRYRLKPGSTVGALEVDGASVFIKPKIEMSQLLSLACYAMSKLRIPEGTVRFQRGRERCPMYLASRT